MDKPARLVFYPKQKDPIQEALEKIKVKTNNIFYGSKSKILKNIEEKIKVLENLEGTQMRLLDYEF